MDRLDSMGVFVAVAELRSFSAAARRLKLSPSLVTRTIAALEERLSIRLLQRTTRNVTLTDAGARYLARARRILSDVEEADGSARAERSVPTGRFVLTAPNVFGRMHVAPAMCGYLAQYPQVNLQLTLSDRKLPLVENGIDAAVRIGFLDDSNLVARRVGATRRVIVASPTYLKRKRPPRAPDDLARHDIIQLAALDSSSSWRFMQEGSVEHVGITPRVLTNSADAAIAHAERGMGLAGVLAYQVADAVRAGRLRVVLAEYELPPLPIHVVYPTTRLLSANVRAFIDLVVETCHWQFVEL
ncbi:MAG TPA: LysR family transcriptional regulator [Polyangiales bacterium]